MTEWITHRLPTEADLSVDGDVLIPCKVKGFNGEVLPGESVANVNGAKIPVGQRWWPGNAEARKAAAAEQEAAAAAAANPEPTPDPTPEPAAEPSPAVAGVPSDQELWQLQREARGLSTDPDSGAGGWVPGDRLSIGNIFAHRALYDRGDADGYRRCLEEAKATWELNSGLASDLTALQEENAQLKSKVEDLNGEIKSLAYGINNFISVNTDKAEAKHRQFDDACKRIAELEQENTELKDALKDLLHSSSQPQLLVVGDFEGELERRGGEVKLEPESESGPAPEPAGLTADGFSCGGCSWFVLRAGDAGHCRKHAPAHNGFPPVFVDGWCGDFIDANDAEPTIPQTPIQ